MTTTAYGTGKYYCSWPLPPRCNRELPRPLLRRNPMAEACVMCRHPGDAMTCAGPQCRGQLQCPLFNVPCREILQLETSVSAVIFPPARKLFFSFPAVYFLAQPFFLPSNSNSPPETFDYQRLSLRGLRLALRVDHHVGSFAGDFIDLMNT